MKRNYLREHLALILICLVFSLLGFLRLNDLSLINPDSARYLVIGNSLAHGKGFVDDTQPDPDRFVVHAPLYPILTSPVQMLFPLSLTAVKIWTLFWGVAALILMYFWILKHTSKRAAIVAALLLAFNPLMLVYSTEVLSEAPFLVFILMLMISADRLTSKIPPSRRDVLFFIASVSGVILLREIGIAIVLAAVIFLAHRKKWALASAALIIPVGLFILWYVRNHFWIGPLPPEQGGNIILMLQHFVTPPDSPLINELALRIALKIQEHGIHLLGMLFYPLYTTMQFKLNIFPSSLHLVLQSIMEVGKYFVMIFAFPVILRGIYVDIKSSSTGLLKLYFLILYLIITCLYPVYDVRFLLPIFVLFIYFTITAIRSWKFSEAFRQKVPVIFITLVMLLPNFSHIYEIIKLNMAYRRSPVAFYKSVRSLPQYPLMFTQPWSMMGAWIRDNIPDSLILASSSKDIVPFLGNHKVAEIDQGVPAPVFERLLRDYNVSYLLIPTRLEGLRVFEFPMRESKRFFFDSVCSIANLNLVRVRSRLREGDRFASDLDGNVDTSQATYYLLEGRRELIKGSYDKASEEFNKALLRNPAHPEILYQNIIAHSLAEDTIGADACFDSLFRLPQALGYAIPARLQIQAMRMVIKARSETFFMSKAVGVGKGADLYWKLGYYRRAADIMNSLFIEDSTYFVGLLWGLHYNIQLGDTLRARNNLKLLENLDKENPVVVAFRRILSLGDSLNGSRDSAALSNYHASIGSQYRKIELDEEAIDEAERALGYNSQNIDAMILLGEQFERKNNLRMAIKNYSDAVRLDPGNSFIQMKRDSLILIRGN